MAEVKLGKTRKEREDRESHALRENLKKRKAQQQARAAMATQADTKQKED